VGTTTTPKTVTVKNNQKVSLNITSIAFTGTDPGDYAQSATTCGSNLAAGAKCTISITFTPKATGGRPASLTITDSAITSPQSMKLVGTGN
jgi:hypothetical protein